MKQPPTRWFQALWFALHLQAAALAQIAVVMHLASAEYHRRKIGEPLEEVEQLPIDMTYLQAIRHRAGRAEQGE